MQIFDPRWLNNRVRLNAKVNSTQKIFSVHNKSLSRLLHLLWYIIALSLVTRWSFLGLIKVLCIVTLVIGLLWILTTVDQMFSNFFILNVHCWQLQIYERWGLTCVLKLRWYVTDVDLKCFDSLEQYVWP